jgi:ATP-dependent DNA helicase Q4
VNKFLTEVFSNGKNSQGKVCSLVKESASRKFDMKEEVLSFYCCCVNVLNFELIEIIDVYR